MASQNNLRPNQHYKQPSQNTSSQHTSQHLSSANILNNQNTQYMQVQETKAKRITTYTLKLSRSDYDQQFPKLKECLRKIKSYYERYDLEYDYKISLYNLEVGTLVISCSIHFNKRLHSGISLSSIINNQQNSSNINDISEKLDFYIQLLEHLNSIKDLYLEPSWINLQPESIIKAGNIQVILTDFLLPGNQISSCSSDNQKMAIWYMGQMSPEQMQTNKCFRQSLIWSLGCLLYYILTTRWPFMSQSRPNSNNGVIGVIRRNIVLCKYTTFSDPTVQEQIFDKIFIELDDNNVGRMSIDQLIEVTSVFLSNNKPRNQQSSQDKNQRKKFNSEFDQDESQFEDQSDLNTIRNSQPIQQQQQQQQQDQTEEVIEEDEYYNTDEENKDNSQLKYSQLTQQQKQQFERSKQNPLKYQTEMQQQPNSLVQSKNNQLKQSEKFTVQEYSSAQKSLKGTPNDDFGYSSNKKDFSSLQSSNLKSSQMKQSQLQGQNIQSNKFKQFEDEPQEHDFQLPDEDHNDVKIANVPSFENLPSMHSSRLGTSRRESQDINMSNIQNMSNLMSNRSMQKAQQQNKKIVLNKSKLNFCGDPDDSRQESSSKKDHPQFEDLQSLKSSMIGSQNSPRDSQMSYSNNKNNHIQATESSFDMAQSYKIKIPGQGGQQQPLNADQLNQLQKSTLTNPSTGQKQPFEIARNNVKSSQQQSDHDGQQSLRSQSQMSSQQQKSLVKQGLSSNRQSNTNQKTALSNNKQPKYNPQKDDIPISFRDSARDSEKSLTQSHSQFGGDFGDDQSSIHQNQDTEQNLDDQIGFIIALSETQCIGITIDTAQFMLFTYDQSNKKGQHQTLLVKNELQPVIGLRQVISVKSVLPNQRYIIATTESNINIFQLDFQYKVQIQLIKQMKIAADCICQSYEEPCFYVAKQNKIGKAFIDVQKDSKVQMSSKKIEFFSSDQVKVSAMCYTIMRDDPNDDDSSFEKVTGNKPSARNKPVQVDGYMGIATSDYSFLILRINGRQGSQEVLANIENAHESDITQVLALTDFTTSLSFVTLSLDTQIKIFGEDGTEEYSMIGDGQVITGLVPPQKSKDFFIVSSFNEELQQSFVEVYRKNIQILKLGPFADNNMVLDLKLFGNKLFIPKSSHSIDRQELKGF